MQELALGRKVALVSGRVALARQQGATGYQGPTIALGVLPVQLVAP